MAPRNFSRQISIEHARVPFHGRHAPLDDEALAASGCAGNLISRRAREMTAHRRIISAFSEHIGRVGRPLIDFHATLACHPSSPGIIDEAAHCRRRMTADRCGAEARPAEAAPPAERLAIISIDAHAA